MIRTWIVAAAFCFLLMPAQAQQKISAPKPFVKRVSSAMKGRYIVITPQTYKTERDRRWPMIVYLHGGEEGGGDINFLTQHSLPKIVLEDPDFPFVLLVPQIAAGKTWEADALLPLIKQVSRTYRVDAHRVYVTGISLGGYGAWDLAVRHPETIAAVAPIAGGGNTIDLKMAEGGRLDALKSIGIWAFHGNGDTAVDASESQRMVGEFQRIGNSSARVTVFTGPHDIWDRAYRDPALYTWFLQHAR
jgi:predicted peptidase